MRAAGPTARPAHSSTHLVEANLDSASPGFFLLCRRDPADPLVSRERGDIGPQPYCRGVRLDGFPEVWRQFVNRAARDRFSSHVSIAFEPWRLTSALSGPR